jgi:hypothetical protein
MNSNSTNIAKKKKCIDCKYFKRFELNEGSVYGNCSVKNKTVRTNSKICKSFVKQEDSSVLKLKTSNKIVIRDGVKYYY